MPMLGKCQRIVVVGAGHSGGRFVESARAAAPSADILLIGRESHRPYERPPLSKAMLTGDADDEKSFLRPISYYAENNIELKLNASVTGIDRVAQYIEIDGQRREPYDHLVITTGARPRPLSIPGAQSRNVFYLRDIDDAVAIRSALNAQARVLVIGAGLIGLEVAASARTRGCSVIVLEAAERPMARVLAPEVAAWLAQRHLNEGVDLRCGVAVRSIADRGSALHVETSAGSIEADIVVVGIGAIPNQELAQSAGLRANDGVVVDEFGRTDDHGISAAGDVTRHFNPILGRHIRLESWQNAQNQAIAVGQNICGEPKPYSEIPWFWSDQFDLNLQIVGLPISWDELVWRGEPDKSQFTVFYLAQKRVVCANAVNNARDIRFARRLIERQAVVASSDLSDPTSNLADLSRAP